jgi:SAM-dependent methyltransferase
MSLQRDQARSNLLKYTDRAFHLLPALLRPRILDLGCGSGVPTLRLLELSDGEVVAVDIDPEALATLEKRAVERGVSHRLKTVVASLEALPFDDGTFDLLWCEGALAVLGFGDSLRAWRCLLRPGGSLVAHDDADDVDGKLKLARVEGYEVLGSFVLPETVWWDDYCALLDERDPNSAEEIALYRQDAARFRSAFFVLRSS